METVHNTVEMEFIRKDDLGRVFKQQSKLTFNGIYKFYTNCGSYTFKQYEVLMEKPIYLGFSVLELSNLLLYETCYDKFKPYFGRENLQLHYMDCDSFVSSIKTQNIVNDLNNLEHLFDFCNLNENEEIFSEKKTEKLLIFST